MVDFKAIYANQADDYDRLVAREDYQGYLQVALEDICHLSAGDQVVELGTGTGRLSRLLVRAAGYVLLTDVSAPMLAVAQVRLREDGRENWRAVLADNRCLPIADGVADLVVAGWTLGHFVGWYPQGWRREISRSLAEMRRLLRPGGRAVIIETLGTGREKPEPPTKGLSAYYDWLEEGHRFRRTWIRTDYRFQDLGEAVALTGFFFGQEMAAQVAVRNWIILPECTGLWWRDF